MNLKLWKRNAMIPCIIVAAIAIATVASVPSAPLGLIDKSLVITAGDSKVYYIDDGRKRLIDSEQVFLAQGFRWTDIRTVDRDKLSRYPDGAPISSLDSTGFPIEQSLLPDLAPTAPYDVRFALEEGRTRLRFTAAFWNRGKGALQLNTNGESVGDGEFDAFQRLFRADGSFIERPVGKLFWHEIHLHYHYADLGRYVLELVQPIAGASAVQPPVVTQKTTFCMRDDLAISAPSDGPKQPRKYAGCKGRQQGVSIGWADVYPANLADQFVDATGLPAGVYKLSFVVDPNQHFAESRRDNNTSVTLLQLDPARRTLKVLATASPYESPNNRYPEGMLVRAADDRKVYVIHDNKKRWLQTEEVVRSYGYAMSSVYDLPKGAVDAIPLDKVVRVAGSSAIYVLNEGGYKRRILNPDILRSYGWSNASATEISQAEFASYPETNLIMRANDNRVYSISARQLVGTVDALPLLGYDPKSVQVVNETDWNAYAVTVVSQNLTVPWDIAFLPDGDMLVTERPGTLRRIGKQPAVIDISAVKHTGEGGLMGIALHPDFAKNHFVYLYFTSADKNLANRIVRFRLEGSRLIEDKVILEHIPTSLYHDGGQIAFGPDRMLYITTGDAETPEIAQNLGNLGGKTLRLTADGAIPSDNPFGTMVWSYGHRNAQGIAWDDKGRMWQTEHGRSGALSGLDELNMVEKGKNYGWPTIQGDATKAGMVTPVRHSGETTTWAPSGIAYANGRLFFAGLRGSSLYAASLGDRGNITDFKAYLSDVYGRLRAVVLGPDGFLYVTTSNKDGRGTVRAGDDKILRIHPDFLR